MNEFLIWLGWNCDYTLPGKVLFSFWTSPLGLFCTGVLAVTSLIRTLHHKSSADLFDTLWHMCMTITAGAAFFMGLQHRAPQNTVKTLIILMAIRGIYKCIQLHYKKRRPWPLPPENN